MKRRILLHGYGSIGRRHLLNLRTLGCTDFLVVDPDEGRAKMAVEDGAVVCSSLDEALAREPDAAFITSPSNLHAGVVKAAVSMDLPIFVEKPLAINSAEVEAAVAEAEVKGVVGFMGSNFKFHPSFVRMKDVIDDGSLGKILSFRIIAGQYLPDWRPWQDYRNSYSAKTGLGGGILLDSHEFTYMSWLLGPAKRVASIVCKRSDLEIETEDTATVLVELQMGTAGHVHLDYTQRFYQRAYEIHGERGLLRWSAEARAVELFTAENQTWTRWDEPRSYELNEMYLQQTSHFLDCLSMKDTPITPLREGLESLRVVEAVKLSSNTRSFQPV